MFDLTRIATLEKLDQWVQIVRQNNPNLPVLFLGTKIDLIEDINVNDDFALSYLESLDLFDYLKISSKTGENVEESFKRLTQEILERQGIQI